MTIRMQNGLMFGALADPDAACEHIFGMLQTKGAILQYVEPIAQVLAEAGRASAQAMGDRPEYAIDQWVKVIRDRAIEILRDGVDVEDEAEKARKKFEQTKYLTPR